MEMTSDKYKALLKIKVKWGKDYNRFRDSKRNNYQNDGKVGKFLPMMSLNLG